MKDIRCSVISATVFGYLWIPHLRNFTLILVPIAFSYLVVECLNQFLVILGTAEQIAGYSDYQIFPISEQVTKCSNFV